jgi:hypothetical protein
VPARGPVRGQGSAVALTTAFCIGWALIAVGFLRIEDRIDRIERRYADRLDELEKKIGR